MTTTAIELLKSRQEELMKERDEWEQMQTDHSYDEDFYRFCQWKMNLLDEEAEQIRIVLESGCVE